MLKSALLVTASIVVGAGAVQLLHAASGPPIYAVAEINVKDKESYNKILPKALEMIKNGGGTYVAGGYDKTKTIIGTPPPNRYVLIRYDGGAEAFDKVWAGGLKDWVEKEGSKYADFRLFNVEAAEMK